MSGKPLELREMGQLYARVFVQILDSSIAEDYTVRHVFEDFLKLVDHKSGAVDRTREAIARRLNMPLDVLNAAIEKLESPDPRSRDSEFEGRRIRRMDEHRDWGWIINNWEKYEALRTKADVSYRVMRHKEKTTPPANEAAEAEKIYELYPRKIGKSDAIRKIAAAIKAHGFDYIKQRTELFALACKNTPDERRNFIPHPATWYNQNRFHDDAKEWAIEFGNNNGKPHVAPQGFSVPQSTAIAYAKSLGDSTGYVIHWLETRQRNNFFGITQVNWKETFKQDFDRWKTKNNK